MQLTAVGQAFARRAQRIQIELQDAVRDIAEVASGGVRHVRIGSVAGPAIDQNPPMIHPRDATRLARQKTLDQPPFKV